MSNDINSVFIIGRLTAAPELRYTSGGSPVANFTVANNREYKVNGEKKQFVSFVPCIAWNKLGEIIAKYCKKGQRVGIEGRLQQRSWEDQSGQKRSSFEIVVDNFQFLESKKAEGAPLDPLQGEDVSGQVPDFDDAEEVTL